MNITLRQLRAFIAAAHTGSFTQAAERLFITQSALSGLIKELEQALGVRLFDRSTRHVQLSDVGRSIQPLIAQMLQDLDGVLDEVSSLKALKKGQVRVASPQLLACTLLPEVIARFTRENPDIEIRLADCAVEDIGTRVLSGEADIGIGPEREPHSGLDSHPLFEQPFHAVFPAGHPLDRHRAVPWSALAVHPLITLRGQFTERLSRELHQARHALDVRPSTTVTFMSTALAMAAAGLGVTLCMPYAASLVHLHGLQMRILRQPEVRRRFHVHTRAGRSLSPAAERFRSQLLEDIGDGGRRQTPARRDDT